MKKIASVLIVAVILLFVAQSAFANKSSFTSSVFTDARLRTWLVKEAGTESIKNDNSVKIGVGPALGYFRQVTDKFTYGFEVKHIGRDTATSLYYGQVYLDIVGKYTYHTVDNVSFYADLALGAVFSYKEERSSWGATAASGIGVEYRFSQALSAGIATRLVGVSEVFIDDTGSLARANMLSWQPVALTLTYRY